LAAFRRENRGSVTVMFGIAAIPIMLAVGAAVDYRLANRAKAVLDQIADAASLSAVSESALSLSASKEQTNAVKFFKAQAASLKRGSLVTVSANVTDNGNGRTEVVNYTANVPTAFMGIVGINNIAVSGSSTAASAILT
jgi:Flp pilus assembly protein TadG